ncbi:MAG: tRNA guanosine(34) transglycosylase Tgt [Armatimonadetes bacterium]|nr:tRNA guanosine(34) transglycosylase Tgt [Armatimonadota bacterium]
MNQFKIIAKCLDTKARIGELETHRGKIQTPVFMPVGTQATVKTLTPQDLTALNAQIILANTYHLYLRPGLEVIQDAKGLHNFMSWPKLILTDSGGFQIFSLKKLTKISDEGVIFRSHIDGSLHTFTPEKVIQIQETLASDIIMPLDECLSYPSGFQESKTSLIRTNFWAKRSKEAHKKNKQILFGIVQGGTHLKLREESIYFLGKLDFPGFAIGGLSVGEPKELMLEVLEFTANLLPAEKPRYLMGVGKPEDLLNGVSLGIDLFDCVLPTRIARNGTVFTHAGKLALKNSCFTKDFNPIDDRCSCFVCQNFTRAYLRHLFICDEILGPRLATFHNLFFIINLMEKIKNAILKGNFLAFKKNFLKEYFQEKEGDKGD